MKKTSKQGILTILIGTVLEWYDFSLLASLAPVISSVFFPAQNPVLSLLATYSMMASGFLIRPLGGVIFGHLGDRYGRTVAFSISILLMTLPTTLIAFLPTYQSIGLLAPVLLTLCRFSQGMASSGEYPGAMCYLFEVAQSTHKARWGSLSMFGVVGGILLGTFVNAMLTSCLSPQHMMAWGWRLPFLLALPLGLLGWYLRYNMADSPLFSAVKSNNQTLVLPIKKLLHGYSSHLIMAIILFSLGSIVFYLGFVYLPSYMVALHLLSLHDSLWYTTASTFIMMLSIPFFGWLADRFNYLHIIMVGSFMYLLCLVPLYQMMLTPTWFFAGQVILSLLSSSLTGAIVATISNLFPTNVRFTGMALALNIGSGVLGSLAPMLAAFLVRHYAMPLLPVIYPLFIAFLNIIVVLAIKYHRQDSSYLQELAYEQISTGERPA